MASFMEDEDTSAFYAVLNVPRTASTEEVTRAYRRLAQVVHPDKHRDEAKRRQAQESFSKVQEAYEVLSDPLKRQVYDVYGKQGLTAGLQVGEHLKSREELRREWEEFRTKQQKSQEDQAVVQKGSYVCRVDARPLIQRGTLGNGPLFKSVVAQSALEAVVAERNVLSLSGQAAVRPALRRTPQGVEEVTLGGGNVVFGYKRVVSEDDTVDVLGQVGLQSLVSVTSTRRLCRLTNRHGWVNGSWSPQAGFGLQVGCSQNLFDGKADGSVNLVVGPAGASGVATTIARRGAKYNVQAKLELGAIHAISVRGSWSLTDSVYLRAIGRVGTTGIDLELGMAKRWTPQIVGYVGGMVGYPAGVVVKVRATRAGQSLECPIHISSSFADWRVVAAAYVVPPLLSYATSRLVVQPLLRWSKAVAEKAKRAQLADETHQALARAAAEQALIEGVARRKLASELGTAAATSPQPSSPGLVVVLAVYGLLPEYRAAALQPPPPPAAPAAAPQPPPPDAGGPAAGGEPSGARAAAGAAGKRAPPPAWVDVTVALQYLVAEGRLVLHGGVPKSGLMGFADPAPHSEDKQLLVAYLHQGTFYEVVVGDTDALALPAPASGGAPQDGGKGSGAAAAAAPQPVTDNARVLALQAQLQRLREAL